MNNPCNAFHIQDKTFLVGLQGIEREYLIFFIGKMTRVFMRAIGKFTKSPIQFRLHSRLTLQILKMGLELSLVSSSMSMFPNLNKPSTSQALVKVHSFCLNRMDWMQREGKYNVPPQAGRFLGVEFSGVIEELGGGDIGDFEVGG